MNLCDATILVVDDEPMLRRGYATWLKRAGCKHVVTAANGLEAFELFLSNEIDMVVSDVRMPVLDGVGLLHSIHRSSKKAPIVIFVSGFSNIEVPEAYDLGVEAFLAKPFSAPILVNTVSKSLTSRAHLWSSPMANAPDTLIIVDRGPELQAQSESCSKTEEQESTLRFGRGGFSCGQAAPLPLVPLSFKLRVDEKTGTIEGQGFVRWFSRETSRVGVEIHYLDPASREAALARVQARACNSFIPL